jgi:hypothetical protein
MDKRGTFSFFGVPKGIKFIKTFPGSGEQDEKK